MNKLIQNITKLSFIGQDDKSLVIQIEINPESDKKIIYNKVLLHDLKFKYTYSAWNQHATESLMKYLCYQKASWKLTDVTLTDLYLFFDKKFSRNVLIQKCFDFGCEYIQ